MGGSTYLQLIKRTNSIRCESERQALEDAFQERVRELNQEYRDYFTNYQEKHCRNPYVKTLFGQKFDPEIDAENKRIMDQYFEGFQRKIDEEAEICAARKYQTSKDYAKEYRCDAEKFVEDMREKRVSFSGNGNRIQPLVEWMTQLCIRQNLNVWFVIEIDHAEAYADEYGHVKLEEYDYLTHQVGVPRDNFMKIAMAEAAAKFVKRELYVHIPNYGALVLNVKDDTGMHFSKKSSGI